MYLFQRDHLKCHVCGYVDGFFIFSNNKNDSDDLKRVK